MRGRVSHRRREGYPRWTDHEIECLKLAIAAGKTIADIASNFKRSYVSVRLKAVRLGLFGAPSMGYLDSSRSVNGKKGGIEALERLKAARRLRPPHVQGTEPFEREWYAVQNRVFCLAMEKHPTERPSEMRFANQGKFKSGKGWLDAPTARRYTPVSRVATQSQLGD